MNLHRLDLVSLSLFHLVARSGSISQGAALAHLAIGAASKRIQDLEATLGTPLLERHSRGVTLTLAGQALHVHAQRILANVDQLTADLSDYASGLIGVVRPWANTSAVTQFLPQAMCGCWWTTCAGRRPPRPGAEAPPASFSAKPLARFRHPRKLRSHTKHSCARPGFAQWRHA